jgi:CheY-like chemotaxis protein
MSIAAGEAAELQAASERPAVSPSSHPPASGGSRVSVAGLRVLVVEDDDDARDLLIEVLSVRGCVVQAAGSAAEAFEQLEADVPDLIISDIGMPDEDGYSLLRRVRALPKERGGQLPAIALTAFTGERDKAMAHAAGFHAHLGKPVRLGELVETMRRLVP